MEQHDAKETDHYIIHYPNRENHDRVESATFRKTKKELREEKHTPCWIGDQNCQQDHLEVHHFFVEWAAASGIDWLKFGEAAKMLMNPQTGEVLGSLFDWQEVAKNPEIFVDSPQNMMVLCAIHHRDTQKGIHHVPFPAWVLQKAQTTGFTFLST